MIRRGDVRWFRFSSPDKRRPVLVLGRNDTSSLGQIPITVHATVHPIDRRHVQLKPCASWGGNGVNSGAPCRTRSVVEEVIAEWPDRREQRRGSRLALRQLSGSPTKRSRRGPPPELAERGPLVRDELEVSTSPALIFALLDGDLAHALGRNLDARVSRLDDQGLLGREELART